MSRQLLAITIAPILGLFIISSGNGLISSLTPLRLDAMGSSALMIGVIGAAYFVGLTLGAFFNDRLILQTGHIRAYSSFASLTAVTILLQGLFPHPLVWLILRLINGWATMGVFLVVESWLLLAADQQHRGRLLAVYMIALYGSCMISQIVLGNIDAMGADAPFMLAGTLSALSVVPMVVIPRVAPEMERVEPIMPQQLLKLTPTGVIGCFGSGIALAAIYSLLPLYLQQVGLDINQVGHMMAYVIFGAMTLQYPVGRWSDRQDRQLVLIVLSVLCVLISAVIIMQPSSPFIALLMFLLGGGIFSLYPVSVSHAADRTTADALVRMIQGMLLINSFGSAISPLIIAPIMSGVGPAGLFWVLAVLHLFLLGFFIWRRMVRPAPTPVAPFEPSTQMTPIGAELRVTDDLVQGAMDQDIAATPEMAAERNPLATEEPPTNS